MKRKDLIRRIGREARQREVTWVLARQGANHEIWRLGSLAVALPRHREIAEMTAQQIFRETEPALGEGWWRR